MKLEMWIERQSKIELAQVPSMLEALVEKFMSENEYNIVLHPARNGFPAGYAMTFKITYNRRKEK